MDSVAQTHWCVKLVCGGKPRPLRHSAAMPLLCKSALHVAEQLPCLMRTPRSRSRPRQSHPCRNRLIKNVVDPHRMGTRLQPVRFCLCARSKRAFASPVTEYHKIAFLVGPAPLRNSLGSRRLDFLRGIVTVSNFLRQTSIARVLG